MISFIWHVRGKVSQFIFLFRQGEVIFFLQSVSERWCDGLWGHFVPEKNDKTRKSIFREIIYSPKILICWHCTKPQVIEDTYTYSYRWDYFFIGTDLKFGITSCAHQWMPCRKWVPSEWESKQLIKTAQQSTSKPHVSSPTIVFVNKSMKMFLKL